MRIGLEEMLGLADREGRRAAGIAGGPDACAGAGGRASQSSRQRAGRGESMPEAPP